MLLIWVRVIVGLLSSTYEEENSSQYAENSSQYAENSSHYAENSQYYMVSIQGLVSL